MKKVLLPSVALLVGLLASASPAAASNLECNGTFSGTFDGPGCAFAAGCEDRDRGDRRDKEVTT